MPQTTSCAASTGSGGGARVSDPVEHIARRIGPGGRCLLMPNGGNLGDALIAAATIQRLRKAGIAWSLIRGQRQTVTPHDVLAFGGGGSLVSLYEGGIACVGSLLELGAPVVVLPQTVNGHPEFWSSVRGVRVFCRDLASVEYLRQFPGVEASFADDMAFGLDLAEAPFAEACALAPGLTAKSRHGTLLAFRGDAESAREVPEGNTDVSVVRQPSFDSPHSIEADAAAFIRIIASHAAIRTDRLHVAIAGALLGMPTVMEDNTYGKNRAVYEASMRGRFPHVRFEERQPPQNS